MARKPQDRPRVHYIPEWAEKRRMRQVDIVEGLNGLVDKSTVSRWFAGSAPESKHLLALAELFQLEEPVSLFRHPDDDWLARFFRGRSEEERYRIRQMLEAAFPWAKAS